MITDELGVPVHPEWYSGEFARLLKRAELRKIRLRDSRHTTLSLMEKAGVPISVISKLPVTTTPRSRCGPTCTRATTT